MSESNVLDILQLLLSKKESLESLESLDKNIYDTTVTLIKQLENYESIDHDFVVTLKNYLGDNLLDKHSYNEIIDAIKHGSTVVYFKSAQLFKIYKQSDLQSLLSGQLRTIYKEFVESYEIVPNDSKQKIVIMGEHSLIKDIASVKTHICKFMLTKGIDSFKEDDIVCFKNNTMLEIIINNYYVSNSIARDAIVKDLLQYIFQEDKNTAIVSKLGRTTFSEFTGVDMIPMPSEKQLLNSTFIEYVDGLVGNIEKCSKLDKQGNTYNITLQVVNMQNATINNAEVINNHGGPDQSEIVDFGKYIRDNKPEWYTPNTLFDKQLLRDKYIDLYGGITKAMFHKSFVNKIFTKTVRVASRNIRIAKVLLFEYNDILNLEGE
jgi:hypothetical protein